MTIRAQVYKETKDDIEIIVNLKVVVKIHRVSPVVLMSSMGVQVCHHGEEGHLAVAHLQLLLGVHVFHQVEGASEVWKRKLMNSAECPLKS